MPDLSTLAYRVDSRFPIWTGLFLESRMLQLCFDFLVDLTTRHSDLRTSKFDIYVNRVNVNKVQPVLDFEDHGTWKLCWSVLMQLGSLPVLTDS